MTVKSVVKLGDIKYYSSITKNLSGKNCSLQFLPISLEEFSKQKNFIYKDHKLKTAYVIDIIHNLILKYYFKKENRFNLMSNILKEKYGYLYKYYIDYLVENKILFLISDYLVGKNSRVYSINESIFRNNIKRYVNYDKVLLKKYKSRMEQFVECDSNDNLINEDIKEKLINDLFKIQIEFDRSIFFLDSLKDNDMDVYNRNRYSIECINDKHIFYHFDKYGRLHTNFTILKSFIRKNCLLIDNEETYEFDIKNSQPLFLTKIIQESKTKWVNNDEFELYKNLTMSGEFYNHIMNNSDIKERTKAKELTYKVLFGRNASNSKADKIFSGLFPTIHNFIKLYKKEYGDYKILSHELQKAESNLIFNKMIRQIMILYPDVNLFTVHDSIIVKKSDKERISAIFETKLYEEFGIIK